MKTSIILLLLCTGICTLSSTSQGQELFYFLTYNSVQAYSAEGEFQASFPLPYLSDEERLTGMTTDGITAWIAKGDEDGNYAILGKPLRPGGISKAFSVEMVPHYFIRGMAQAGDTLFLGRDRHPNYVTEVYKIERYSASSGGFIGSCFASFWPDDMQWVNGKLVAAAHDYVHIYVDGCSVERQFYVDVLPGHGISAVCANSSFIWVFKPYGDLISTGLAFEWNGTRRADKDIVFNGLSIPTAACIAWGPDEPNIRIDKTSLDFGDISDGTTKAMTITVRNVGNLNLSISPIALSDNVNYSLSGPTSGTLIPGQEMVIPITFQPQTVGIFNATLTINSNDPDQPSLECPLTGQGRASVTYVDGSRGTSGNGQTWGTAFNSISAALTSVEVVDNTEIWIKGGTYNITSEIPLEKAVSLYGGFAGTETSRSQRDTQAYPTIIDAGQSCRCMHVTTSGTIVIDGLKFQNGMIGNPDYYGAGMWLENESLNVSVIDCTFDSCSAYYQGGGLYCRLIASAMIENCSFTNCQATEGGGLYCENNTIVSRCRIANNTGQGINTRGNVQILKCLVIENVGGGISTYGPAIIKDSVVAGNTEANRGNGIYTSYEGNSQIINCTIIDNDLWLETTCTLTNSILWKIGANYLDINNYGTIRYSAILNPSYGTSTGQDTNGNTHQYPMFIDPDGPDNDPTTYSDNNYAIASGSPCVDAANGSVASSMDYNGNPRYDNAAKTDIGTGTPSFVDIGAYESQLPTPNVLYVDPDATGAGTGRSWGDALTDIQTAIDIVPTGKSIYIKTGTYLSLPIEVKRNCMIYGGFAGTESSPDQRNIETNATILDGEGANQGITFDHLTVTIDGITCRNCTNGIYAMQECNLTVKNCLITEGTSEINTSGIYISGNLAISDCVLTKNKQAAIYASYGGLMMEHCLVAGNYGNGITIIFPEADSVIENCTFVDNLGNGIYKAFNTADLQVRNCLITDNTSGTVNNYQGTFKVEYCNLNSGDFGIRNINVDPLFAQSGSWNDNATPGDTTDDIYTIGDYHLQSEFGRWNPITNTWITDAQTSLCIDAGDPESNWENEPWPSKRRINIGCYGGTIQASKSGEIGPDLTLNGWIGLEDLEIIALSWLSEDQTCDLYPPGGDGIINLSDFAMIAINYLPEPEQIVLDFENNEFDPAYTWSTGGTPGFSVIAANMTPDNQYQATSATSTVPKYTNSYLTLTVDAGQLDTMTFAYKMVNSGNRVKGEFYMDNVKVADLASKDWTQVKFDITPGTHTYKWAAINTTWMDANESMRLDDIIFIASPP